MFLDFSNDYPACLLLKFASIFRSVQFAWMNLKTSSFTSDFPVATIFMVNVQSIGLTLSLIQIRLFLVQCAENWFD